QPRDLRTRSSERPTVPTDGSLRHRDQAMVKNLLGRRWVYWHKRWLPKQPGGLGPRDIRRVSPNGYQRGDMPTAQVILYTVLVLVNVAAIIAWIGVSK